jgi:glutathione S-transferase
MIRIWGRTSSINVQKVMWAVAELGLAHEQIDAGGKFGGLDTAAFRSLNPNARVPVIEDGDHVVWESHTIVRYLAAKYGTNGLWPSDPYVRSLSDRWMDWALADLQPAFIGGVFWAYYRTPEHQRQWPAIRQAVTRCSSLFRLLDRHLMGKSFLAGDDLTIGDIVAGVHLYRYFELAIERPVIPNVEAWYARLAARPGYRAQVMQPFEELRGRLSA